MVVTKTTSPAPSRMAQFIASARNVCAVPGVLGIRAYTYVEDRLFSSKNSEANRAQQEHRARVTSPEYIEEQKRQNSAFEENRKTIIKSTEEIQKILYGTTATEDGPTDHGDIQNQSTVYRRCDLQ